MSIKEKCESSQKYTMNITHTENTLLCSYPRTKVVLPKRKITKLNEHRNADNKTSSLITQSKHQSKHLR